MDTHIDTLRISFSEPGNLIMCGIIKFHDFLFYFLLLISLFVTCMFIIISINFVIGGFNKMNQGIIKIRKEILSVITLTHFPVIEFFWTVFPTLILMNMAIPTFIILYAMDCMMLPFFTIKVLGNQWYWSYETNDFPWHKYDFNFDSYMIHPFDISNGEKRLLEVDTSIVVPTKEELRILVTSRDVLHSFAIPSLSMKIDAVPGRLNYFTCIIRVPGVYFGQCSELCGPNHGFMPISFSAQPK